MTYPFRAAAFLARRPNLWPFVVVPIGINLIVAIVLYAGLLFAGFRAVDALVAGLPEWLAPATWFLRLLLIIGLFVLIGFLLVRFGVVLGSPWYDRLSRRIEELRTGRPLSPDTGSLSGLLRDIGRALRFEMQKLLLVLGLGLPILLLNFVPVAGSVAATIGGIALGTLIACLDFFDPPLERRRLSFRAKLRAIGRGLPGTAGFGVVCWLLVSVPFVNLLSIPLCTAAGTLYYVDRLTTTLDYLLTS